MADAPMDYPLHVGANEYTVLRDGTECTINVSPSFFSPRLVNESRNAWMTRVSRPFYLDLNKIPRVKSASVVVPSRITITMEQANNWGNIASGVRDAFQAHLQRREKGEYGS